MRGWTGEQGGGGLGEEKGKLGRRVVTRVPKDPLVTAPRGITWIMRGRGEGRGEGREG